MDNSLSKPQEQCAAENSGNPSLLNCERIPLIESDDTSNVSEPRLLLEGFSSPSNSQPLLSDLQKRKRNGKGKSSIPNLEAATLSEIISHPSLSFDVEEGKRQAERRKLKKSVTKDPIPTRNEAPTTTAGSNSVPKLVIRNGKVTYEDVNVGAPRREEVKIVDQNGTRITSSSFKTRNHTEKWAAEETRKFFKGLEIFGSDFSMIAKLFPNRTRAQMKNKFRKEERMNPSHVEEALKKHHKKRIIPNKLLQTVTGEERQPNVRRDSVDSLDLRIVDDLCSMLQGAIASSNLSTVHSNNAAVGLHD